MLRVFRKDCAFFWETLKLGIVPVNEWVDVDDIIIEGTTTEVSAGEYTGPLELGLKKWNKTQLSPFDIIVKKR